MLKKKYIKNLQGFSLLEIIVTMGIMMLLASIVFPLTIQKVQESKLENYASQLVTDIYYQQQRSALRKTPTGVSLSTHVYTLFDGETLNTSIEKDIKVYPSNITVTSISLSGGNNEIFFEEGEFKPTSYGTLVLTDGLNSMRVYINREGLIGYEKL